MATKSATLDDVMGGIVEIPAAVQHYEIKSDGDIIYRGYGAAGADADIDRLMKERISALWLHFWEEWPGSCDWVVEWEE